MQFNKVYYISMYISLKESLKYASNNLSIYCSSNVNFTIGTYDILYLTPHIFKFGNPIISDTLNWTKIEGVYKAGGGEHFITIGNFKDDAHTNTLETGNGWYEGAYYFIDDVSVEEITEPFWQYRDTTIHFGDSVLIGPALTGLDINWYTANDAFLANAPGIYVKPETSRNYIAKEMFNDVETTHLVHVTVLGGVGLVENELENVAVYPNPNNGTFSLRGFPIAIGMAKTGIKIYNLAGQCVWAEEINEGINSTEIEINVSLENGVYVLELRNERGSLVRRKLRIEN